MKTARSRRGCIDNPNLTYQAEPREVKLRKIINGETNNMEDGVFPTIVSAHVLICLVSVLIYPAVTISVVVSVVSESVSV